VNMHLMQEQHSKTFVYKIDPLKGGVALLFLFKRRERVMRLVVSAIVFWRVFVDVEFVWFMRFIDCD
jgi:hypothetical protein